MKAPANWARRSWMSGLGAVAAGLAIGGRQAAAQTPPPTPFTPARHAQDEWLEKLSGKHRVVLDVTSSKGMPDLIRFVGNLYTANKSAYGLDEPDLAILVILRHSATAFGYGDAVWVKYAKPLAEATQYSDPKSTEPLLGNPFNTAPRRALDAMVKRGVQIAVCETASRGIARMLAGSGDPEATFKEMGGNLVVASGRLVPAGVVAVSRAQEYGYSLVFVG